MSPASGQLEQMSVDIRFQKVTVISTINSKLSLSWIMELWARVINP